MVVPEPAPDRGSGQAPRVSGIHDHPFSKFLCGGTAGTSDRNGPGLVRPSGIDLDLDLITQRGEKAHEPFERDFAEFSSKNLRQLGLRGSDPPRGGALGQAQGLDGLVQPLR